MTSKPSLHITNMASSSNPAPIQTTAPSPQPPPSQTLLYFAYGSNLSTTQMALRCPDATPIALGRLAGWEFMINARGFANVVPSTATSTTTFPASSTFDASPAVNQGVSSYSSSSSASASTKIPKDEVNGTIKGQASKNRATKIESVPGVVYGVVYQLASYEEKELLDGYEGVSAGAYEDLILPVEILNNKRGATAGQKAAKGGKAWKWIWGWKHWLGKHKVRDDNENDNDNKIKDKAAQREKKKENEKMGVGVGMVWALVYVDRLRTSGTGEYQPRKEYVGRMNRGIRESVAEWGLPGEYVKGVLRRFIPEEDAR